MKELYKLIIYNNKKKKKVERVMSARVPIMKRFIEANEALLSCYEAIDKSELEAMN